MAKRRPKASRSEVRKARKLISKAFQKKGKEARAAKRKIESRVRREMTAFVRDRFVDVRTKAQARSIQRRMSLAGVARRAGRSEVRARYTRDASGRWYRADGTPVPGKDIKQQSANVKRAQSMAGYWNQVRIIAAAPH